MTDRRLLPANARVAARELEGQIVAGRLSDGQWHRIAAPVVDLLCAPGAARDRQLLLGQRVRVLDIHEGSAFLQSERDGYVGYVDARSLIDDARPTHRVTAIATHLYPAPDMKRHEQLWLSHGSLLSIVAHTGSWAETDTGAFVHTGHLAPLDAPPADPIDTALLFIGTPYLWGGNSSAGIDCSGLVQAALLAAGIACPADSDHQCAALGVPLPEATPARRGDLFFWEGHVAMAVDATDLIHANAHHMAVACEPIDAAVERIGAREFGALIAHKRLG